MHDIHAASFCFSPPPFSSATSLPTDWDSDKKKMFKIGWECMAKVKEKRDFFFFSKIFTVSSVEHLKIAYQPIINHFTITTECRFFFFLFYFGTYYIVHLIKSNIPSVKPINDECECVPKQKIKKKNLSYKWVLWTTEKKFSWMLHASRNCYTQNVWSCC